MRQQHVSPEALWDTSQLLRGLWVLTCLVFEVLHIGRYFQTSWHMPKYITVHIYVYMRNEGILFIPFVCMYI